MDPLSQSQSDQTADGLGGMPIGKVLDEFHQKIWGKRPILGEIMQKHGGKFLYDYSQDFMDANPSPYLDARKPELIDAVHMLVEQRIGKPIADGVAEQLRHLPLVSTADHHAPIDHPFWVNANLITAIPYLQRNNDWLKYLIIFSFASVSCNNLSGFPRGIQFYGGIDGSKNVLRVPIMPDKDKMGIVYGMRPYTLEEVERAKATIRKHVKDGIVLPDRGEKLIELLDTYFAAPNVLASSHLASQISKINFALWPKLFHNVPGEPEAPQQVPDLLYLEIETIVRKLLVEKHLNNPSSLLYRALFDTAFRPLIREHFNNVPGAFSVEKGWGTYFFWYIDDKHRRVQLYYHDEQTLATQDGQTVALTPEGITQALHDKRIFPSMLLCYLMISLYYGMKCLGGFCQVNDLTMTKHAWRTILRTLGETEEADALEPVQTKELGGDGMVLPYTRTIEGDLIPASGIDMVISDGDTRVDRYVERAKTVTLNEMMNPMLPEMYTVLYAQTDREPALSAVTPEAILKATGLAEKMDRAR